MNYSEGIQNQDTPKRETLVIEIRKGEKIGTDENASDIVKKYMKELAERMGVQMVHQPETHLSPKFGLSGWLPTKSEEGASAIHIYDWDDRDPSFISVDISMPNATPDDKKKEIINWTSEYFSAKKIATKTNKDRNDWQELAPEILRQRLSLRVKLNDVLKNGGLEIIQEKLIKYLEELCPVLDMNGISKPLAIIDNEISSISAWVHWETSGAIISCKDGFLDIDIYTCKEFNPETAINFTQKKLGEILYSKSF